MRGQQRQARWPPLISGPASLARSRPTCAGVPGLNEAPDDGIALITCLLNTLALLLVEAVLQENPDIGLLLIGILQGKTIE